jgi:alkylation response protein AidB-like acyl-CoA dehydrogenase
MTRFYSKRDLYFQLFENQNCLELTHLPYFADHSEETFKLVLDSAEQIAEKSLRPLLTEMDRNEPQLIDGQIRIHPGMKAIIRQFGEDGWINALFSYEEGGQQLPWTIHIAAGFIFQAANYSASVFPFLTTGAANLIRTFGSKELIEKFTPNLYSGLWQGTMALTEPDAGSSLSDISTTAFPTEKSNVFKIKGQKIYISAGDHDACENIVHLMIGSNDDCEGYLVGEANQGLKYMFQMMNEARLGVGMNAVGIASAAYHASLAYAKERPQGRKVTEKNLSQPQVPIIEHADVKRMLLFQKSVVEGSLALLIYCAILSDKIAHEENEVRKNEMEVLLDLLTPIAKSYPSEMGVQSTSAAVQVLGGAGYTTDFPVEQYYREARIHPIHEGTTGIHGLDLLGRKVLIQEGLGWKLFQQEILLAIESSKEFSELDSIQQTFEFQFDKFNHAAAQLLFKMNQGPEEFLADATLFLEASGIICIAWMWLRQAESAQKALNSGATEQDFYFGKIETARYFMEYELPKINGLIERFHSNTYPTVAMRKEWF